MFSLEQPTILRSQAAAILVQTGYNLLLYIYIYESHIYI